MRIGDIGGLAVVMLAALVNAASIQAAAAPGNVVVTMETGGPLDPLNHRARLYDSGFVYPGRKKSPGNPACRIIAHGDLEALPAREWRVCSGPEPVAECLPLPPEFSAQTDREFTIIVRIRDASSSGKEITDRLEGWKRYVIPPKHAIRRDQERYANEEQEMKGVLDRLQEKLLELHDGNWFHVEFSPKGAERTELRIQYRPVESTFQFGYYGWETPTRTHPSESTLGSHADPHGRAPNDPGDSA
jgi:hypothetical protein